MMCTLTDTDIVSISIYCLRCSCPTSRRLPLCASLRPSYSGGLSRCPPPLLRLDGALAVPLPPCPLPLTPLQLPMPNSSTASCFASALSRPHAPQSHLSHPPLPPPPRVPILP